MDKLNNFKDKIKKGINTGADKFLSSKIKDELGLNRPTIDSLMSLSESPDVEGNINTFYKPVNSTFLSSKDYKNLRSWIIAFVVILFTALGFLFFTMLVPNKNYSNALSDSQIIVDGNEIVIEDDDIEEEVDEKISEPTATDDEPNEDLQVQDITIASEDTAEKLAEQSPLLQSNNVTLMEYKIKSGDTLETIALRFYGRSTPDYVNKIKVANKIRNVRLIQVGQKIIIPM